MVPKNRLLMFVSGSLQCNAFHRARTTGLAALPMFELWESNARSGPITTVIQALLCSEYDTSEMPKPHLQSSAGLAADASVAIPLARPQKSLADIKLSLYVVVVKSAYNRSLSRPGAVFLDGYHHVYRALERKGCPACRRCDRNELLQQRTGSRLSA